MFSALAILLLFLTLVAIAGGLAVVIRELASPISWGRLDPFPAPTSSAPASSAPPSSPSSPIATAPRARVVVALMLGCVALTFAVGARTAGSRAMWTDDMYSLLTVSRQGFGEIVRESANYRPGVTDHPPLHFLLLKTSYAVGGNRLWLRAPGLLLVGLTAGLWAAFFRKLGAPLWIAAAAAAPSILHPEAFIQATTLRMYPLFGLLATLALFLAWGLAARGAAGRIALRQPDPWLAMGLTGLLLALAHYTSYFALLFSAGFGLIGLAWLAAPRRFGLTGRRAGGLLLGACFVAGLLTAPWLPAIGRIFAHESGREAYALLAGQGRAGQLWAVLRELGGAGWLFLLFAAGWIALAANRAAPARGQLLLAFAALVALPILGLAAASPDARTIYVRYAFPAIGLFMAGGLLGWIALAQRRPRLARPACIALLAVCIAGPSHVLLTRRLAPVPDWWGVAEILRHNARDGEFVLTGGFLSFPLLTYHLGADAGRFRYIHDAMAFDNFYLNARADSVVWYVNAAPLPEPFQAVVERYYPWRAEVWTNGLSWPVVVAAKREFALPHRNGEPAPRHEPVRLEWEQ